MAGDLFLDPNATISRGKRDAKLKAKICALPFVRTRTKGEKGIGRHFWSVTASGDYAADYNQGRAWALLVLPFLKFNVGPPLLSWIVADMIAAGEKNGLVLGFIREIGQQLGSVSVH